MWKKWFWVTTAFGVELCALHDCGLGCLVASNNPQLKGGWRPTWQQQLIIQAGLPLAKETIIALKPTRYGRHWLALGFICGIVLV